MNVDEHRSGVSRAALKAIGHKDYKKDRDRQLPFLWLLCSLRPIYLFLTGLPRPALFIRGQFAC
jgi:hypothetical protein